ncbi:hypothetical protein [Aquimarina sediminis]|uniref:hypothetical protein n=1 Tax=Aquimarina sediminis TaxID=2070536 RepID=UPI000CA00319|nr:hypothetical protein [Aquimarina sediminis]
MIIRTYNNCEFEIEGDFCDFQKLYKLLDLNTDFSVELDSCINPLPYDSICSCLSVRFTEGKIRYEYGDREFKIFWSVENLNVLKRNIDFNKNYKGHIHFDYISFPDNIEIGHELVISKQTEGTTLYKKN